MYFPKNLPNYKPYKPVPAICTVAMNEYINQGLYINDTFFHLPLLPFLLIHCTYALLSSIFFTLSKKHHNSIILLHPMSRIYSLPLGRNQISKRTMSFVYYDLPLINPYYILCLHCVCLISMPLDILSFKTWSN